MHMLALGLRPGRPTKGRCEMTGYHTLAFGKALYDVRTTLGLSVAELALRASLTEDDIERIEEGGTEPTIPLQRRPPPPSTPTSTSPPATTWLSLVRNPRRLTPPRPGSNACCPAPEPPDMALVGSVKLTV